MYVQIVEDSELFRIALERWLKSRGHTVCWSSNGAAAISQISREVGIEIILLDLMLGEGQVTGFDVARFLMEDEKTRKLPVIIISGMPIEQIREKARSISHLLSSAIIMTKPIDMDQLEAFLHVADSAKLPDLA